MDIDHNKALVVFSGGQDSTTCLGWALTVFDEVVCITFDYNQRHRIEIEAAKNVIRFFEQQTGRTISHEIIPVAGIFTGMSPLTNPNEDLELYESNAEMEAIIGDRVEKTFVPMRNAAFLMIAANRAAVHGCGNIVTGVCQADNANYPDCRHSFVQSAQDTINEALGLTGKRAIIVQTPLIYLTKSESIMLAKGLGDAYHALAWSHTAYDGRFPPTGKDHASTLRAHGFEEAGVPDPLVVRAWMSNLMDLPSSVNYDVLREGAEPLPNYLEELMDLIADFEPPLLGVE